MFSAHVFYGNKLPGLLIFFQVRSAVAASPEFADLKYNRVGERILVKKLSENHKGKSDVPCRSRRSPQ